MRLKFIDRDDKREVITLPSSFWWEATSRIPRLLALILFHFADHTGGCPALAFELAGITTPPSKMTEEEWDVAMAAWRAYIRGTAAMFLEYVAARDADDEQRAAQLATEACQRMGRMLPYLWD